MTTIDFTPRDVWMIAEKIASSGLFGMRRPEEAFALMMIAQAEGLHPALAARDFHVIQGRPALKADAMLARFQSAGGKVEWHEYTDTKVSATFTHPAGGSVTITWTIEMAKRIGLASRDNWRNYPRQLLRARVASEGVRTVFPGCVAGVYTPEEVQDFGQAHPATVEHETPTAAIADPTPTAAIAGPATTPAETIDLDREVVVQLKGARKTARLRDLDRAHAEKALRMAEWRISNPRERDVATATADAAMLRRLLETMPAPEPAPEAEAAPEAAPAPIEADVLSSKELVVCGFLKGKGGAQGAAIKKIVADMDGDELQNALDLALLDQADATKAPRALGIITLVQAEIATRAN